MRTTAYLLIGTAAVAFTTPALAQTTQEDVAQAVNPPDATQTQTAQAAHSGDIIVTATKRASRVQDVPFSINAQTEQDIQRANAQTIEDISRNVAGLAVQNLGPGQSQVSIRGVSAGQIVRDQPGVKEQVGVYLDESVISLSLFTPDFDLFDLNRVETLRGPQGTLFGSGSVGGTVRYITNQPQIGQTTAMIEANVNAVDESDIGSHLKGTVNVPLGHNGALRAVAYGTRFAGFIDAIGPAAGKNINDGTRYGGRVSLLYELTPDVKITPRIVYQKASANGFNREEVYNFYANEFTTPATTFDSRQQFLMRRERFEDETLLADLTASVGFGGAEVTSITTYINRDILVSRDASALSGSVGIVPFTTVFGFNPSIAGLTSNLRDTTDLKQWTQELRVSSTGAGPLQWVVGAFYSDIDRFYRQRLPTPGYDARVDAVFGAGTSVAVANGFPADSPYNSDLPYDIRQGAVFGEGSYDFGDIKVTAGGRYYEFREERDFVSGGIFSDVNTNLGDKTKSNGFSPRAILTYEPNRNLSVNLQAAKGFRLGGVNDPLNVPLCQGSDIDTFGGFQTYDDETLWNYEAGLKSQFGGITFNAAAFYTDIKNLQTTVDAGTCSSRIVFNAPKAHTMGVEAEMSARPAPGLNLSLAGSLIEAEFDADVRDANGNIIGGIRNGNRLPSVPRFQAAATATYSQPMGSNAEWYVTASAQHVGSRYTQPGDQEPGAGTFPVIFFNRTNNTYGFGTRTLDLKLPSYQLVNLSTGIEWMDGREVVLYVNNLFDENAPLAFDRERGGRARLGFHVTQPRTIGITIRQKFSQ
ncbi:MAG TPA: TonB-dependent receptor [Sphingomicrobium sp.]|jgi:iron complex outermembrane recepter protein|nr:TonB-dependent receptor [Sphingomicrobium sp.]